MAEEKKTFLTFKELTIWQKSSELAAIVISQTAALPDEARVLSRQIQITATTVPAQVAAAHSLKYISGYSYQYHLRRALGQVAQLDTLLTLAQELGFLEEDSEVLELIDAITRMSVVMIKKQQEKQAQKSEEREKEAN
jgi:four helix bundle protein